VALRDATVSVGCVVISNGLLVASGIRCKREGRGFGFMVILSDGADILSGVAVLAGGDGAWRELAGWVELRAAQVLEQPEPVDVAGG